MSSKLLDSNGLAYLWSKLKTSLGNLQSITYDDLKSLRDNSKLVPGKKYRITDYTCTTTQTSTKSAGHQFDIIVEALSNNKLGEEAKAILHAGDTYFSSCKLEAWKIWYCLDNDTTRFGWADSTNGKGVVYRMIDENNNDCPYDFKNIQFIPYFKTSVTWYAYTFNSIIDADGGTDNSLAGKSNSVSVYNNIIKSSKSGINKIMIGGVSSYGNTIDDDSSNITLLATTNSKIGKESSNIEIDSLSEDILIGNNNSNIRIGPLCYRIQIKDRCSGITMGNFNSNNTFESSSSATLGQFNSNNTFESGSSATLGNNCNNNIIYQGCTSNVIGNYCNGLIIGGDTNTIPDYTSNSTFECNSVTLTGATTITSTSYINSILVGPGVTGSVVCQSVGNSYMWVISKDSDGNILQYCPDDIATTTDLDKILV